MNHDGFDFGRHGETEQVDDGKESQGEQCDFQQRIRIIEEMMRPLEEPTQEIILVLVTEPRVRGIRPGQENH